MPPVWKVIPSDVESVDGDSVLLNCQGTGKPEPSVTWMRSIGNFVLKLKNINYFYAIF